MFERFFSESVSATTWGSEDPQPTAPAANAKVRKAPTLRQTRSLIATLRVNRGTMPPPAGLATADRKVFGRGRPSVTTKNGNWVKILWRIVGVTSIPRYPLSGWDDMPMVDGDGTGGCVVTDAETQRSQAEF